MLVLTRKKNEQIVISLNGQTIRVRVITMDAQKVRLGVVAPGEISVDREEVWNRKSEYAKDRSALDGSRHTKNTLDLPSG